MSDLRFYTLVLIFGSIATPPSIFFVAVCFNAFAGRVMTNVATSLPAENVQELRPMPLSEWDKRVAPHLQFITSGAQMAARHARMLPVRPGFQSYAEDELAQCRQVLTEALAEIERAQAEYQCKRADA